MTSIGIVGTGISGLQLALMLQQAEIDTVVYADRTADQIRDGRLPNTVARFGRTREREKALGVDHWDFDHDGWAMYCAYFWIKGDPPLTFRGELSRPASFVDFRLYLPQLLADYEDRGGKVVVRTVTSADIATLASAHDLMVVATGSKSLTELFPRDPERSPFDAPQRVLMAGLFTGIEQADPTGLRYHISPGAGELFQAPFFSFPGRIANLLIEAVPGGPLAHLAELRYEDDPKAFDRAVLDALRDHATPVFEHVDPNDFGLTRPVDVVQGAITPTVRSASCDLGDGKFAMAVGDMWVINDPVLGQGANLGSTCAWVMAEAIRDARGFDEAFCYATEARMWEYARPVTEWTNAALQPPPPHALGVFGAGSQDQRVADALVDGFDDPAAQWSRFSSPEGAAAFLSSFDLTPASA